MRKLVTVVALMTLASLATADVIVPPGTATGLYKVTNAPPAAGLVSYTVVWVGQVGDPGSFMSAFDGDLTGTLSQIAGFGGGLSTVWAEPSGGWLDNQIVNALYIDTHLLIPQDVALSAQKPEVEDISGATFLMNGQYGPIVHGTGTYLRGTPANLAIAIPLGDQAAVTEIMQVVTTVGTATLEGTIVTNSGSGNPVNQSVGSVPELPEPTALILLGIGALGTVIRRKRA